MSSNKCSKGQRSGAHGPARKLVTERNKARRLKKYLKKMNKRWAKTKARLMMEANAPKVIHRKKNPGPNNMGHERTDLHTIRLRDSEDGKVKLIDGLTITGSYPSGFDQLKEGDGDACVHFLTKSNKPFSPRLKEFSFVIAARETAA